MKKTKKSLQLCLATLAVVFGCVLIGAAFVVPPSGVIDPTVLAAFGEILTFAGAVLGIDYNYKFKIHSRKEVEDENPCY